MQTHGSTAATSAIESVERRWFIKLEVDWNRDGNYTHALSNLSGFADNVVVRRALAGSAPQEVMLIEGASAAELSFDLGGEDPESDDLNFVAVFSPYNGLSPFYNLDPVGCEIKYSIGIDTTAGVVWYQQFIGNIRTITPNRATRTVSFSALDRVEKLRTPVQFPVWGMSDFMAQRGYQIAQLADSSWVIDHCLRFGDTSVTPFRPLYPEEFTKTNDELDDGVRFWLTGTGSHIPTVGFMAGDQSQGFPKTETGNPSMYYEIGNPHPDADSSYEPVVLSSLGPNASGLTSQYEQSAAWNAYWALDRNTNNLLSAHYIGFTMHNTGFNGNWWRNPGNETPVVQFVLGSHIKLVVTVYQGSIRGEVRNYNTNGGSVSAWFALPNSDHIQIDVVFALGGGASNSFIGVLVNQSIQWITDPIADWSAHIDGTYDPLTGYLTVEHKAAISDVYASSRWAPTGGVYDDAQFTNNARKKAKYPAVLDRGLNKLTHLPVTNAEDAWKIITDVAAAELGSVFWDEYGIFRFWNRETITEKQSTVWRTYTLDQVQGLQITNSFDSIRNIVTAESTRGYARTQVAYESNSIEEFYVPGLTRVKFTRYLDNIQSVGSRFVTRYCTVFDPANPHPIWDNDGDYEGYVVQWFDVSGGSVWREINNRSGLEVTSYGNEDGSLTIEIWNGYSDAARLATGASGDSSSAALRILGSQVFRDEVAILSNSNAASIAKYGRRNYPITGEWVQWQPDVVPSLLSYILPRTLSSIPTTDAITVAGDPRLQLGDRVDLVDPDGMGEKIGLQIYGIERSYSRDTGLVDTLTVEMLSPSRIGIWDSAQYGLWDSTFIWS